MKSTSSPIDLLQKLMIGSCLAATILPGLATAQSPFLEKVFKPLKRNGHPPATRSDPAVEELAKNLDWLEHQLEQWGSVVPKTPDIWGDARLTKYRREVEEQLQKQVSTFAFGQISGVQETRDIASLESDLKIGANETTPTGVFDPIPLNLPTEMQVTNKDVQVEQITQLDQLKRYLDHLNELRRINEGDDISDTPGYSLNLVRIPISILPGQRTREGFGAEVTLNVQPVYDELLLANTFRDLVINDVIDQIAVPVTQFINQDTKKARQVVKLFDLSINTEKYLEQIRDFVSRRPHLYDLGQVQAIKDGLGTSTGFQFYEISTGKIISIPRDYSELKQFCHEIALIEAVRSKLSAAAIEKQELLTAGKETIQRGLQELWAAPVASTESASPFKLGPDIASALQRVRNMPQTDPDLAQPENIQDMSVTLQTALTETSKGLEQVEKDLKAYQEKAEVSEKVLTFADENGLIDFALDLNRLALTDLTVTPSNSRRSTLPYPPRHLIRNIGFEEMAAILTDIFTAFEQDVINRKIVHLTDVQSYLRDELTAAYELLAQTDLADIWLEAEASQSRLARAVRLRDHSAIDTERNLFISHLSSDSGNDALVTNEGAVVEFKDRFQVEDRSTRALAWAIFIESMLLNERLKESIRNTLGDDQCAESMTFYGPRPSPEACDQFSRYVSVRWPLRVFTVDPVVSEQNIDSTSQVFRQSQLLVAASFASGKVNANSATRMLRKIQRDMATIDLNRTVVGFAHGDQTFGWRFYPRFQVAPVEGNAKVLFRDLIGGGPTDEQLLRSRKIEPGMRECLAIIVMPSFVGRATIDSRSSWFRLDSPKHSALSHQETVQYSRSIETMKYHAQACVRCPDLYRDGEVSRLLSRVEQLSNQLPAQTLSFAVPTENNLGGFEILSAGTGELAPELLGWYGAPGYSTENGAHFFLAGDNFSVHETSLIAGNQVIPSTAIRMLSRQILEVRLPANLPFVTDNRMNDSDEDTYAGYIDLHLATPYGVSGHLLIPVLQSAPPPPPVDNSPILQDISPVVHLFYDKDKNGVCKIVQIAPCALPIAQITTNATGVPGGVPATITMKMESKQGPLNPVTFAPISPDRDASYNLQGSAVMEAAAPKGSLFNSLEVYGNWLLECPDGNCDHLDGSPVSISYTAEIAFGEAPPIKAKGKSHLILVFKKITK
jgi:hypothetical protein